MNNNTEKKELDLCDIKRTAFDLLNHFKHFCQKNDINFFLSNGTLLGAVKYKGFIPWDDDIDVLVPRDDYNKLIHLFKNEGRYHLLSPEREPKFKYPFAKLCDFETLKCEENIDNGIQLGVDIDIFPLDECSLHILQSGIQRKIKAYSMGCMLSKFVTSSGKPLYKRVIIDYCRKKGYRYFCDCFTKLIYDEICLGSTHKGCLMWPVYGANEVLPAEVFSETIEVEFEGEKFPAPIGYDTYLRSLYGDYEKDPPIEKQQTHHRFKAYKL